MAIRQLQIAVCIKQIVGITAPVATDLGENDVRPQDVPRILNPCDGAAIAFASAVRHICGVGTVTAVSAGPKPVEKALRKALALGACQAVRVEVQKEEALDEHATAVLLAAAVRSLGCSLVLCGEQAQDTMGGQVGPGIAAILDWPVISAAMENDMSIMPDGRKINLWRRIENGKRQFVECDLPALVTVGSASHVPGYPSLPALMRALRAEIAVVSPIDLGITPDQLAGFILARAISIALPKPRPKKIFTPDDALSAADRMRQIMSGGIPRRSSDTLEGPPARVAAELIQQLRQRKVI